MWIGGQPEPLRRFGTISVVVGAGCLRTPVSHSQEA